MEFILITASQDEVNLNESEGFYSPIDTDFDMEDYLLSMEEE